MKKVIYTPEPIEEAIVLAAGNRNDLTTGVLITGQRVKVLKLLFPTIIKGEKVLEMPELKPIVDALDSKEDLEYWTKNEEGILVRRTAKWWSRTPLDNYDHIYETKEAAEARMAEIGSLGKCTPYRSEDDDRLILILSNTPDGLDWQSRTTSAKKVFIKQQRALYTKQMEQAKYELAMLQVNADEKFDLE